MDQVFDDIEAVIVLKTLTDNLQFAIDEFMADRSEKNKLRRDLCKKELTDHNQTHFEYNGYNRLMTWPQTKLWRKLNV